MTKLLKIGMIGLDTSHCELFADLLNNPEHPFHVPGGRLTIAYPGGSDDFELSRSRVDTYTKQLRDAFGVQIVESMERVTEEADAILLTSVDGRVHQEQFARIAPYQKPVFIDKPFAVSTEEARAIAETAAKWQVPMFSCSSLRYAEPLVQALKETGGGAIIGADCSGPMPVEPPLPPLFWYGIHTVEALYAIMGKDCVSVSVRMNKDHEVIVGEWRDDESEPPAATARAAGRSADSFIVKRRRSLSICMRVRSLPWPDCLRRRCICFVRASSRSGRRKCWKSSVFLKRPTRADERAKPSFYKWGDDCIFASKRPGNPFRKT